MSITKPSGLRATTGRVILRTGRHFSRWVRRTLVSGEGPPETFPPLEEITRRVPVVFYFGEPPVRLYQLRQWYGVIERIAAEHEVAVVARTWSTAQIVADETSTPVHYARTLDALLRTYDALDPKVLVYCNNGMRNFQSLIYRRATHVHVNHGESDKLVMASNQAKAYDKVVVAGQVALERYRANLLEFDPEHFAVVGRPQLDIDTPSEVPPAPPGVRTILYAPTWQGEDAADDYSSVDTYGAGIATAALSLPQVRLLYKPHPRTLAATEPEIVAAHAAILAQIAEANRQHGSELHLTPFDANVLGLFGAVDLLVTDVSSVGLDFLYLRPEAPIVLTDRFSDRETLRSLSPLAEAADIIDETTAPRTSDLLLANLRADPLRAERLAMSRRYFGFARGQSTERLLAFLRDTMARRDTEVAGLRATPASFAARDSFNRDADESAGDDSASPE